MERSRRIRSAVILEAVLLFDGSNPLGEWKVAAKISRGNNGGRLYQMGRF